MVEIPRMEGWIG